MTEKNLSEYNVQDLYTLFSTLYKEKHGIEYKGVGFIGNEIHLLKVAIEQNGAEQMVCAILNCIESNDRTVNVPYFVAGLKYYLTSYNPHIYWAVKRYGDSRIKKLWTHFMFLDAVWLPKATQKKQREEIFKILKDWAYEKTNKKKRKTPTKAKNRKTI